MKGREFSDFLDSFGLYSNEAILGLHSQSADKVIRFYHDFYSRLNSMRPVSSSFALEESRPFKFMASASVRGDSGCSEPECRATKVDFLARFAALYAETLILPLGLPSPASVKSRRQAAMLLEPILLSLLQLRPLIDADVVIPTTMVTRHCEHEAPKIKEMMRAVYLLVDEIARDAAGRFAIYYQTPEKSPTGLPTVYINGPDDFVEHGGLVALLDKPPSWRQAGWRYGAAGRVQIKGHKRLAFVRLVLDKIAADTTFYLASALHDDFRYLTDRRGEAILLDALDNDDAAVATSNAMRQYLAHALPFLSAAPVASLLRIRQEQRDEFVRYRQAVDEVLKAIVAKKKRVDAKDAQELGAKIAKELTNLKRELQKERTRQLKRYGTSVSLLLAAVAIGVFGIPHVDHAVTAGTATFMGAGGGRLLGKALESTCDHSTSSARSNDFYFLLRVARELGV